MSPVARALVTFIAWSATAAVLAPVFFFVTVLLAGPHSDMLPALLQPPLWLLGWLGWILAPVLVARKVWRRNRRSPEPTGPRDP